MGKVKLTRGSKGANKLRSYTIFIDGDLVGKIKRNQTLEFDVSEGTHTVQCKIDWEKSNELTIEVTDQPIELEVNAKNAVESAVRSFLPIDGRNKYLILSQVK
jgi:hypothetical protein